MNENGGLHRTDFTADDYRVELARRDSDDQTRTMLSLTKWIAVLTSANVVLVAYSVFH